MNLRNIRVASKVAGTLFNRFRELNNEQQRDVYEAVRIMARGGDGEDGNGTNAEEEDTSNFSEARLKAGDVTRAAHARLDRRRALFDAEQLDKKEKKELEKALKKRQKAAKNKKKGGIALSALILALLAAAAGAVYFFIFGSDSPTASTKAKKGTAPKQPAPPTVQRTQPPTKGSTRVTTVNATNASSTPNTNDHGPLSEEPAERDEELLSSIDEQLSTLDTLDDDQRGGADQR
ncbi:hypothetical protein SAMN05444817_101264 [Corynebacterium appendicis CIP 107643]|uniref:Uncharacterized protein n=1 Tax=Corynebacterium appendicis CIP 107643 TaxID=1161099 RepID=A0A1N7IQ53_9CORY|nr:hypothetical protein [Corynebacterium appendicis]WJY59990.1 hypothetical protein CAPP_00145 [Corynebacterium appendicis CIP 107643]SIS39198.1 hypothetical protein SAMN05444817_101264 [Corynebacterium appendicis CIP 107643]